MISERIILDSERDDLNVKSTQGSRLTGTVQENKNVFDRLVEFLCDTFNGLVEDLQEGTAASEIGARIGEDETIQTVQDALDKLNEDMSSLGDDFSDLGIGADFPDRMEAKAIRAETAASDAEIYARESNAASKRMPYIGTNGNWLLYNMETEQFEDSGYHADGTGIATQYIAYTLLKDSWNLVSGKYMYTFENEYPSSTYDIEVQLDGSTCTYAHVREWIDAKIIGCINENAIHSYGTRPTMDIPVMLKVVRYNGL